MKSRYNRSKFVAYLVEALEAGADESVLAKEAAAYLLDNGKGSELESVLRDAQELRAQKYGKVELTARSAHELDNAIEEQIKSIARDQYNGAKNVTIHKVHDETVVAGAAVSFPQASLDVTVRDKLNRLRKAIS